jgi:glycosyltransferase involved in cell wall biosynthesis
MNTIPEVSIIIPTYNRASTVVESIYSVINQTFKDFELIVVDDGSTDETIKVVSQILDARINLISLKFNKGASAARNAGIAEAKGDFIAFLDSDDKWLPEKLEIQTNFLRNNPEFSSCSTGYFKFNPKKGFIASNPSKPKSNLEMHLLKSMDLSFGTTLLVKRICFETVGLLDETFPRHEDWDWVLRYIKVYKHHVIDEPLVEIVRSTSVDPQKIEKANQLLLMKHHNQFYEFGKSYGRKVEALRWIEVAQAYFLVRKTKKGMQYFGKAILLYPFAGTGTFIAMLDSMTGSNLRPIIKSIIKRIRKK